LAADDWLADNRPERVLVVGRPTLSRPVARLLRGEVAPVEVVTSGTTWADPGHAVARVHDPRALADPEDGPGVPAFLAAWRKAGERARAAVTGVLDAEPARTGAHAARAVAAAVP